MDITEALERFYCLLAKLEKHQGKVKLADLQKIKNLPRQGVYFFFEDSELRENGNERVVRVGTHAIKEQAKSTLKQRLRAHHGTVAGRYPGGGNHRASIFRAHVGRALIKKEALVGYSSWDSNKKNIERTTLDTEYILENKVSQYLRNLSILVLNVSGEQSWKKRAYIEKMSIELLTTLKQNPSSDWLGNCAADKKITDSGLWNVQHVSEKGSIKNWSATEFLDTLESLIDKQFK